MKVTAHPADLTEFPSQGIIGKLNASSVQRRELRLAPIEAFCILKYLKTAVAIKVENENLWKDSAHLGNINTNLMDERIELLEFAEWMLGRTEMDNVDETAASLLDLYKQNRPS